MRRCCEAVTINRARLVTSEVIITRTRFCFSMSSSSRVFNVTRIAIGTIFVLAGTFKLVAPFGNLLAQMNVPFPQLAGRAVPFLEIGGGAILLLHRKFPQKIVRLFSLGLAIDMIFAIALVGAPGVSGRAQKIQNHAIGTEAWRIPLELFMLAATLWFAARGTQRKSSTR